MDLNDKYLFLPEKYWNKHDLCMYLVSQLEDFIIDKTYSGLKLFSIEVENEDTPKKDEHLFDFLIRTKRKDLHDKMITSHLLHGLIIDICYFLQEALACSKKERLVVTFSLLRKPFVYDLIVLLRLIFEDGFVNKFNTIDNFDTTGLSRDDKVLLLKEATKYSITKSITEIELYEFIFDTANPNSIINMSNKALHPSTTKNINNRTGKQNLNFAFSTPEDINKQRDYIYSVLPMLLIFYIEITEIFVFSLLSLDSKVHITRIEARAKKLIELTGIKIDE